MANYCKFVPRECPITFLTSGWWIPMKNLPSVEKCRRISQVILKPMPINIEWISSYSKYPDNICRWRTSFNIWSIATSTIRRGLTGIVKGQSFPRVKLLFHFEVRKFSENNNVIPYKSLLRFTIMKCLISWDYQKIYRYIFSNTTL